MEATAPVVKTPPARPFGVWVTVGGFLWSGIALMAYMGSLMGGPGASDPSLIAGFVFAGLLLLSGFVAWRARRSSFIAAAVLAIVFLLLLVVPLGGTLANPADSTFWFVASVLGALLLSLIFSILCLRALPAGLETKTYLTSVRSPGGLLVVGTASVILAAIVVSAIIGASFQTTLEVQGLDADVRIVSGAASATTPFTPANITVQAGTEVSFFNGDRMEHSVTGENAVFGSSPTLRGGERWSLNLTTPGTYRYFCGPHPWMKGTVVVTP